MQDIIYADLIGDISLGNGVVRLDLYSERPQPTGPDGVQPPPPQFEMRARLILPLPGLLKAYPLFDALREHLESQGIKISPSTAAGEQTC
jgi:hypothetical protein